MRLWADNAVSTLSADITAGSTSLTLATGDGSKFPSPTGVDYFDITLTQPGNVESSWEKCKVASRSGDVLTVERGMYGSTAASWPAGSKVELRAHAGALESFATLGKAVIGHFPAASMKPQTTSGCAALAYDESSTNKVMTGYLSFDAAAIEYAQFSFKTPEGLDESAGFTAFFEWMEAASATTHDVVWQIEIQAQGDGDTVDSAFGAAVTVTDTGTAGTRRITAQTGTITPGGSWAAGDDIIVRVSRKATDGADSLNVDANLIGVTLLATYVNTTEA